MIDDAFKLSVILMTVNARGNSLRTGWLLAHGKKSWAL